MLVTFRICFKQQCDTRYLVIYNSSPPRMFLSLDLLWEYRIQHGVNGPLYIPSSHSTWIFCRGVSGVATDCPCGVGVVDITVYLSMCIQFLLIVLLILAKHTSNVSSTSNSLSRNAWLHNTDTNKIEVTWAETLIRLRHLKRDVPFQKFIIYLGFRF